MYRRALDLRALVEHRSVFLFGPRQTGKSTLVRHTFPDAAVYDLLEADTFHQLSTHPEHLRQTLEPGGQTRSSSERGGRLAVIQLVQAEDERWRPPVLSASSDSHPVAS